jgi:GntR family transcriptional repressor for pyruvate dehydrogenase complex
MNSSAVSLARIGDTDKIQRIIEAIQDFIIDGHLEHGTELPPERILAAQLGVSRFSLREALRVSEAQGLIEISRGRRPRVARPSAAAAAKVIALTLRRTRKTLLDLIAARQGLESQIARLAARNAAGSQIAALKATIRIIEENHDNPDICVEQDIAFHQILVDATDNVVFEIMLAPLGELLRDSRKETIRVGVDRVIQGHKKILAAIIKRDPERAAAAMHQHLKMAEEDLRKMLRRPSRRRLR